ncbi:transporter substrate-binding domain-containing protein [Aliiglaciecola sp. CAU 1673]|uniref:substrate-binding periplasmic protein n=1 Tax=Aliiglaciecola sp. CAU 1673 TaxID=3032595 RepID=UPI0023DB46D1|nr:transporter substrate-binding domain-containing protein [Aliiglaciecola sp. CAU 1673]MDF2179955.1 transporter substrate-binding domain-containing protein [Aliiglaciecola sp. CAU 1673]
MKGMLRLILSMVCLLLSHSVLAKPQLLVVSEAWENATHADGSGLYWDILREIYGQDYELKLETVSYQRAVNLAMQKDADMVLGLYLNEYPNLLFPNRHMDADRLAVLYNVKNNSNWQGQTSLTGKRVGRVLGYRFAEYLENKQYTELTIKERPVGIRHVLEGSLDYLLDNQTDIEFALQAAGILSDDLRMAQLKLLPLYPGFAQTDRAAQLAKQFDEGMLKLFESGKLKSLFEQYHWDYFPFENW